MGDLSGVRVGDKICVKTYGRPATTVRVTKVGSKWVHTSAARFSRADGVHAEGYGRALTLVEHARAVNVSEAEAELRAFGVSIDRHVDAREERILAIRSALGTMLRGVAPRTEGT